MYHPTRGGTRGGQAEFSWDQVRNDKDREHYLGHAIMAPTGRWQNGRDVTWYNKDKNETSKEQAARLEELQKIKLAEEQALASVLGYVPKGSSGSTVGSALLTGSSSSRTVGSSSRTGANTAPLDPSNSRWPASTSQRKQQHDDDSEASGDEADVGSGLTKEERKFARKMAKAEVKKQLLLEKEQRKAEREEKRARKREREERRHRHGDDRSPRSDRDRELRSKRYSEDQEYDGRSPSSRRRRDEGDDRRRDEHRQRSRSPSRREDRDRHTRKSRSRSPEPRHPHRDHAESRRNDEPRSRREEGYYGRISATSRHERSPTPPYGRRA
ncbi:hypothetical protein OC861_003629 [Tilletia horrida]|nr:hypothetical protein OC845_003656 [Tilletia horrida]KAK0565682.1 hypothetical protein OC861_003629 [Tilletia horrida]